MSNRGYKRRDVGDLEKGFKVPIKEIEKECKAVCAVIATVKNRLLGRADGPVRPFVGEVLQQVLVEVVGGLMPAKPAKPDAVVSASEPASTENMVLACRAALEIVPSLLREMIRPVIQAVIANLRAHLAPEDLLPCPNKCPRRQRRDCPGEQCERFKKVSVLLLKDHAGELTPDNCCFERFHEDGERGVAEVAKLLADKMGPTAKNSKTSIDQFDLSTLINLVVYYRRFAAAHDGSAEAAALVRTLEALRESRNFRLCHPPEYSSTAPRAPRCSPFAQPLCSSRPLRPCPGRPPRKSRSGCSSRASWGSSPRSSRGSRPRSPRTTSTWGR